MVTAQKILLLLVIGGLPSGLAAQDSASSENRQAPERGRVERRFGQFALRGTQEELEDLEAVLEAIASTASGAALIQELQDALARNGRTLAILYEDPLRHGMVRGSGPYGRYVREESLFLFNQDLHRALRRCLEDPHERARAQISTFSHEMEHALQYEAYGAAEPLKETEFGATLRHVRVMAEAGGLPAPPRECREPDLEKVANFLRSRQGDYELTGFLGEDAEAVLEILLVEVERRYRFITPAEEVLARRPDPSLPDSEQEDLRRRCAGARSMCRYIEQAREEFRQWLASR